MATTFVPCTSVEQVMELHELGLLVCNSADAGQRPRWLPSGETSAMEFVLSAFSGRPFQHYEWQRSDYAYVLED